MNEYYHHCLHKDTVAISRLLSEFPQISTELCVFIIYIPLSLSIYINVWRDITLENPRANVFSLTSSLFISAI